MAEAKLTIHDKVAEDIAAMTSDVETAIVDVLVDREKKRRVDAFVIVYDRWKKMLPEISKAEKPDVVSYDNKGAIVSSSFTKKALDALNKLKEKHVKLEKALVKALTSSEAGDWNDVFNIANAKEDSGGKGKEGDNAPASEESS